MEPVKKIVIIVSIAMTLILIVSRLILGLFVIPPMGVLESGTTIVYVRTGLNCDFIESVDGMNLDNGQGVSLFSRLIGLKFVAEEIIPRKLFQLPYSNSLYLNSTDGQNFLH
jgi:hypothetical protein